MVAMDPSGFYWRCHNVWSHWNVVQINAGEKATRVEVNAWHESAADSLDSHVFDSSSAILCLLLGLICKFAWRERKFPSFESCPSKGSIGNSHRALYVYCFIVNINSPPNFIIVIRYRCVRNTMLNATMTSLLMRHWNTICSGLCKFLLLKFNVSMPNVSKLTQKNNRRSGAASAWSWDVGLFILYLRAAGLRNHEGSTVHTWRCNKLICGGSNYQKFTK